MNFIQRNLSRGIAPVKILVVVTILAVLAAFLLPVNAQLATPGGNQTGQPNFFYVDTNYGSFYVTNGQTLSYTAGGTNTYAKTIRQNLGLSLFLTVYSTNNVPSSTSTNYTVKFDVTGDGTTWTSGQGAYPITWTVPLAGNITGAFTNTFWTNIQLATVSNIRKIQATQVSTTSTTNLFGRLGYSQSNQ